MIIDILVITLIIVSSDDSSVSLNAKNYLSLDWHPKAKPKFFNEKAAEEFNQDDSFKDRANPRKKQRTHVGI